MTPALGEGGKQGEGEAVLFVVIALRTDGRTGRRALGQYDRQSLPYLANKMSSKGGKNPFWSAVEKEVRGTKAPPPRVTPTWSAAIGSNDCEVRPRYNPVTVVSSKRRPMPPARPSLRVDGKQGGEDWKNGNDATAEWNSEALALTNLDRCLSWVEEGLDKRGRRRILSRPHSSLVPRLFFPSLSSLSDKKALERIRHSPERGSTRRRARRGGRAGERCECFNVFSERQRRRCGGRCFKKKLLVRNYLASN